MKDSFEKLFGPIVGKGFQAIVYADGEYAVKLYREGYPKQNVFSEALIMASLELFNFPSPKVYEVLMVNGQFGLRMDQVKGKAMSDDLDNPKKIYEVLDDMVNLQCRLQNYDGGSWDSLPDIKTRFFNDLKSNDKLSSDLKKKFLSKLEKLPDGNDFCHCDFHADNVFFDGENYTIIDLLQICKGDPAADAACSYVAYSFDNQDYAKYYLNQYCKVSGVSRERVLEWVPVYAATILGQVPEKASTILEKFIAEM